MKNLKRVTALMLCVLMVLSSIPTAYAAGVKVDDFTKDVYNEWLAASKKAAAAEVTTMTAVGYTNKANVELYYNSFIGQLVGEFLKPAGVVSDAGTAMVIIGVGEGEWSNEGYYRVRYNGNEYRVHQDNMTLQIEAPECDCGNSDNPLTTHADSCARKAYYHNVANLFTAEEIAGIWDTMSFDEEEHMLEYLGWTDQEKQSAILDMVKKVITETVNGVKVTVKGGKNVEINADVSIPEGVKSLFENDGHWQLTFDIDSEPNPDGVEIEYGGLCIPSNTWARVIHFLETEDEITEAIERGSNVLYKNDIAYEVLPALVSSATGTVKFTAYTFSAFTVDFFNGDNWGYSLKGGTSIYLSKLLNELNYNIPLTAIEKVEFSNPEYVMVEKSGNDWILTSEQPFKSEEHLFITFSNGEIFDIFVLDEQKSTLGASGSISPTLDVTKVGNAVENIEGEYEVVFKVKAKKSSPDKPVGIDIALLFDVSSSLSPSDFQSVISACKVFVNTVLSSEDIDCRVALIPFASLADTYIIGGGFYTYSNRNDAITALNGVTQGLYTAMPTALYYARELFNTQSSSNRQKAVVLMSDGKPTASYGFAGDSKTVYTMNFKSSKSSYGYEYDSVSTYDDFEDSSIVYDTSRKHEDTMMGSSDTHNVGSQVKVKWKKIGSSSVSSDKGIGFNALTIYEAVMLKKYTKASLYTFGFKSQASTALLSKMAGNGGNYQQISNAESLASAFADIASTLKIAATDTVVTDPMGLKVNLQKELGTLYTNNINEYLSTANIYVSKGTVSKDESDTLTWNIGEIEFGEEATMKYRVKIKDNEYGKDIPLNNGAEINYYVSGNLINEDIPDPVGEQEEPKVTISYVAKCKNDVPDGTNFGTVSRVSEEVAVSTGTALGSTASANAPTFKFVGWYDNENGTGDPISTAETYVPVKVEGKYREATYYAFFEYNVAEYIVKHYQQKVDKSGYDEVEEDRQTLSGTIGEATEASAETYDGFTANPFEQKTIAPDDSDTVVIYYDRNPHKITYVVENDDPSKDKEENLVFGQEIIDYSPEQTYFDFDGWYTDEQYTDEWLKPDTMPDEDITVYGQFIRQTADLTVVKNGMDEGEFAIITVNGDGETLKATVCGNGGSVVFGDLKVGETYTVSEESAWSWRYTSEVSVSSITIQKAPAENKVTITNTKNNNNWLSDEARAHNEFDKGN